MSRLAVVLAALLASVPAASAELGQTLWLEGLPQATARVAGAEVPAARFPCARCHGSDAAGRREGATAAPDVAWSALQARGYDRTSFARMLRTGIAPDGRVLHRAMPRYEISEAAVAALAGYLAGASQRRLLGITPDAVVFGCLIPPDAPPDLVQRYSAAWRAVFADRPVFGRYPVLKIVVASADASPDIEALGVLAMTCGTSGRTPESDATRAEMRRIRDSLAAAGRPLTVERFRQAFVRRLGSAPQLVLP